MIIGLHDAEYDHMKKSFPNFALMKLSAYHKSIGDTAEWWNPIDNAKYDKVYSSKVFDFTPENEYLPDCTVKGGTGYGLYNELPKEIDEMFPDYSIYPDCDYAIGFLTRGCPNKCPWCYVPQKEGEIRAYANWKQIVRSDSNKIVLMDNNILACPYGIEQLAELANTDYKIDLNQGMDVRLLTDDVCKILKKIKWIKYIRFSCDTEQQLPYFEKLNELFVKHNLPRSRVSIYLLVRKDLAEAERRVQALFKIYGSFSLYAMPERNDKKNIIPTKPQKLFAGRYVYRRLYRNETWNEYSKRHGIYDEFATESTDKRIYWNS